MSRRFSNEPINLIRRIPSPEQLDAARSVKRPVGGKLGETAASFARSVGELLTHIGSQRVGVDTAESHAAPHMKMDELPEEGGEAEYELQDQQICVAERQRPGQTEAAHAEVPKKQTDRARIEPLSIQPDELAELRGYLLTQQHDIARLATQVQELKTLVLSQQHIIEYLSKELEIGSVALLAGGVTSVMAKQNRSSHIKPMMNEKEVESEADSIRSPMKV